MLKQIGITLVLFMGITAVINGQTKMKSDTRALLKELGSMLTQSSETKEDCQALINRIKEWQEKKMKDLGSTQAMNCNSLPGKVGSSSQWGSGWLDLGTLTDFVKGDLLRLTVGGTARMIRVRLLPQGVDAGQPQGMVEGAMKIPKSRIVEVSLETDHKGIIQISVHGKTPWGEFLCENNGPATLVSVELCRPKK
jgi:hypothetical protein